MAIRFCVVVAQFFKTSFGGKPPFLLPFWLLPHDFVILST